MKHGISFIIEYFTHLTMNIFRVIFIFLILIDSTLEERQKNKKGRRRAQQQTRRQKQSRKTSPNRQNKLRRLIQNDQPKRNLERDRRAPFPRKMIKLIYCLGKASKIILKKSREFSLTQRPRPPGGVK